jgi:hypothetical protein
MAFREFGNPPRGPFSAAEATNPVAGTVMADTTALPAGNYDVRVTVGASATAQFRLEHRNAANDANVGDTVVLYGAAGQSGQYVFSVVLETGERVRVVMDDTLAAGLASAAINAEQLT